MGEEQVRAPRGDVAITLTGLGITLLGVVLSIGATAAFGIRGPWWLRLLVGATVTTGLVLLIKLGSTTERGPIARLAKWVISAPP